MRRLNFDFFVLSFMEDAQTLLSLLLIANIPGAFSTVLWT